MEPVYVEIVEKTIVGVGGNFIPIMSPQSNAGDVIGPLWDRFLARRGELKAADTGIAYGVLTVIADKNSMTHQSELRYIAGIEIAPTSSLPEGMEPIQISGGRYAVFTHKGHLHDFGTTVKFIYGHWLPRSGKKLRNVPHFELYDAARFQHDSADSEVDIYLPVS